MMNVQGLEIILFGLLGLLIGSFLNVVIYRLPVMLEAQWKTEAAGYSNIELPAGEKFNLMVPRSRCQKCNHQIRWFENIPVVSYAFLRAKCAQCKTPLAFATPALNLSPALCLAFVHGNGEQAPQRWHGRDLAPA